MTFPRSAGPPAELRTDQFIIRPQDVADNASDFAAVVANGDWLRRWSGSDWPGDSFNLDDNLDDLRGHIDDHRERHAFGYSILLSSTKAVVGSLYVQEIGEWLDEYGASREIRASLTAFQARVDLWTRIDEDPALLANAADAASRWFRETWPIDAVFCARVGCPELIAAYEAAGMEPIVTLVHAESGRVQLLFR